VYEIKAEPLLTPEYRNYIQISCKHFNSISFKIKNNECFITKISSRAVRCITHVNTPAHKVISFQKCGGHD